MEHIQLLERIPYNRGHLYICNESQQAYSTYKSEITKNRIYLKCYKRGCSGTVVINTQNEVIRRLKGHINHGSQTNDIALIRIKHAIKRRCESESSPLRLIYDQEIAAQPMAVVTRMPYTTMNRNMVRWRNKWLPVSPTSISNLAEALASQEYVSLGMSQESADVPKKIFFRGIVGNHSLLFVSENLNLPTALGQENSTIAFDGTFKAVPNLPDALQTLTLMVHCRNKAIAAVWAVMSTKERSHYFEVIERVKEIVPNLNPENIIVDFESALIAAVRESFPNARLIGCHFHFIQALRRKRRKPNIGLSDEVLRSNPHLLIFFEKMKALPLLPAEDMEAAITLLENEVDDARAAPFISYVRRYWLPKREILSVFRAVRRTNNDMESYHKHILRHMGGGTRGGARPNTWVYLDALRMLENIYRVEHGQIQLTTRAAWQQSRAYTEHDNQVRAAMNEYVVGDISSIIHMLTWMRHHVPEILNGEPLDNSEEQSEFDELVSYEIEEVIEEEEEEVEAQEEHVAPAPAEDDEPEAILPPIQPQIAEEVDVSDAPYDSNIHCFVCRIRQKAFIIIPCAHNGVCDECKATLEDAEPTEWRRRCPFCRELGIQIKPIHDV